VALVPLLLAVCCYSKAVPALIQPSGTPNEPVDSAGALTLETGGQGRDGLATGDGQETHGPEPRAPVFWPGFRLGWMFGFVFFTATLWWIQYVTLPGMLALTAYLALYPALAMGVSGWLRIWRKAGRRVMLGKLLVMAGVWTGLEWGRSVALWGFPWNGLAVPLFEFGGMRLLSASIGVIGLSSLVFFTSCLLGVCCWIRKIRPITLILLLLIAIPLIDLWLMDASLENDGRMLSIGQRDANSAILIQPNVTMEQKMSPDPEVQRQRYFDLVAQTDAALAATAGPDGKLEVDLVIWPESAVPGFFDEMVAGGAFSDQLQQADFTLVTGADHREWEKLYNSIAIMRGTTDNRAIHPKIRLVPFGEFIPFRKQVPLFEKLLGNLIPMDFNAGTSLEPMKVDGQPFSIVPLVCFEDTIGDHARKFIRPGPQVIVNVTNDNWFHESPATEMHFVNARWRAVELRRTLVRSANTGVTAIVSPWGSVQRIPSHQQGVVTATFNTGSGEITFYARHGDLFSQCAGGMALLGCLGVGWRRHRRARGRG